MYQLDLIEIKNDVFPLTGHLSDRKVRRSTCSIVTELMCFIMATLQTSNYEFENQV